MVCRRVKAAQRFLTKTREHVTQTTLDHIVYTVFVTELDSKTRQALRKLAVSTAVGLEYLILHERRFGSKNNERLSL